MVNNPFKWNWHLRVIARDFAKLLSKTPTWIFPNRKHTKMILILNWYCVTGDFYCKGNADQPKGSGRGTPRYNLCLVWLNKFDKVTGLQSPFWPVEMSIFKRVGTINATASKRTAKKSIYQFCECFLCANALAMLQLIVLSRGVVGVVRWQDFS